jgi:cation diffusion facilitator CzcD-associated flavoprotein CzcO
LLTALDELKGFEERVGSQRPRGESYSRDFAGPNWLDRRKSAAAFADTQPAVLVVGGGQAGLSVAARLAQREIDTLIVDRWPRIGDNWRRRYQALTLHNQVHVNHLPYMPFPPNWPVYIPKDKLAGWFEAYVEALELNYWTGTEFEGGAYDDAEKRWTVTLRRADGRKHELRPRHIVMANGLFGAPNLPDIPSLREFGGKIQHASQYQAGEAWAGKRAIVIGSGTCGHDIAQNLHSAGAEVTLVQRSPTVIVSIEPSGQLPYRLYAEGPPLEDCDLIAASIPLALARKTQQIITRKAMELDSELLERLERVGFKLDFGADGTGWVFKFLTRGGGFYFNVGCSDLIADGRIGLAQFSNIAEFVKEGARMRNGDTLAADLIVLATGYKGQDHVVRQLFGDAVAARVGPVWGFGDGQDLRNMYTRTAQPGLWFIAGSFAHCRIYSKYVGLQIQACEAGLLSPQLEGL